MQQSFALLDHDHSYFNEPYQQEHLLDTMDPVNENQNEVLSEEEIEKKQAFKKLQKRAKNCIYDDFYCF